MWRFRQLSFVLVLASAAHAAIYENIANVDSEQDLFQLAEDGEISEELRDQLLQLMREGVDFNEADRDELYDLPGLTYTDVDAILEYRKSKGRISDPLELVAAGAIAAEQLLQLAPYIRLEPEKMVLPIAGHVRAVGAFTNADNEPPPAILAARVKGPLNLTAGFLLSTTRRQLAPTHYDAVADTQVTQGFNYRVNLPRAFLQWSAGKRKIVAGTFTLGFGERLVLDNTRRTTPHGIYQTEDFRRPRDLVRTCKLSSGDPLSGACSDGQSNIYITPDYDWAQPFRGVAGSIEDIALGTEAKMNAYAFLSYQTRDIYQYELYDRRDCDDPRGTQTSCKAPPVYIDQGPLTGDTKVIYSTLTGAYNELTGGGHVELLPNYQFRVGVTGYGSLPLFPDSPQQLDFQEWSHVPGGGAFGALGVDGRLSYKGFNFNLEVARTITRTIGENGGGYAVEQRTTWGDHTQELELSLRFYDDHFASPYARPIAGPDEFEGQRARDEAGARLRYSVRPNKDWRIRAMVNAWALPYTNPRLGPAGTTNIYGLARVDFTGWRFFEPSVWLDARNRNVASSEHGTCASGTYVYTEGDAFVCSGDFYRAALRIEVNPMRELGFIAQGWFTLKDDIRYKDRFRQDVQFWAEVRARPTDWLRLRLRSRYLNEDISDDTYLETSLWTYLDAEFKLPAGFTIDARYGAWVWLDRRSTTPTRIPNPEHRFALDVRYKF